jgi:hypothetical protein
MVAVAIMGITIGLEVGRKRRAKYLESARHYADMERLVQGTAELDERFARGKRLQADLFRQTEANLVVRQAQNAGLESPQTTNFAEIHPAK